MPTSIPPKTEATPEKETTTKSPPDWKWPHPCHRYGDPAHCPVCGRARTEADELEDRHHEHEAREVEDLIDRHVDPPGLLALECAHFLNVASVFGVSYSVMHFVFHAHGYVPGEVATLNGALCYFERDASMRVALALHTSVRLPLENAFRRRRPPKDSSP